MPAGTDDQRDEILAVARQMFAQRGFRGTTTRQLNKRLGIAYGLLYYYFPGGKQELLDTIVHQGLEQRLAAVEFDFTNVQSTSELIAKIERLFTSVWQLFCQQDNYESFVITVRERPLLSDDESCWVNLVVAAIQSEFLAALIPCCSVVHLSRKQLPMVASLLMDVLYRQLFQALLITNQRELTEPIQLTMRAEIKFILQN